MTKVLESRYETLGFPGSLVGFIDPLAQDAEPTNDVSRKLTIDGSPVYNLGVYCGTCRFLFKRIGATRPDVIPTSILTERLQTGLERIEDDVVEAFAALLPVHDYLISLLEIRPTLVMPGDSTDYFKYESVPLFGLDAPFYDLPPNPGTPYYRVGSNVFEPLGQLYGYSRGEPYQLRAAIHGFLAPMESIRALNPSTVEAYMQRRDAPQPTAVAISVAERWSPSMPRDGAEEAVATGIHAHYCWAHYLLDGHHKVRAASLTSRPLTLLSFTHLGMGVGGPDLVEQFLDVLS